MQEIECALCGNKQKKQLLYIATFTKHDVTAKTFSARRNPDRIHYQLNKCIKCTLIFSSPIFTKDKIAQLYTDSYLSYVDQVPYATKTYISLFKKIENRLPTNPSVMEIGCGEGFYLQALQKRGIKKLFGVEPSKKMVAAMPPALRKNTKQSIFKKNLFIKNKFDVVNCFHTIDHVTDPNEMVNETNKILKKKGLALFVMHDTDALSAKILGEKSPIFDIEHIYLFNKKTITTLFRKHAFNIIEIGDVKNSYPLSYWFQMLNTPSFIKTPIANFLTSTSLGTIPFSFKGGNIYIIAQKN